MKHDEGRIMMSYEEALDAILNSAVPRGAERVGLCDCLNRVLAQDVKADSDVPPFNKSAMDGYACRREDLARVLTVVDTIIAGREPKVGRINPGECARIMTGAIVPGGADCVVMQEDVEEVADDCVRCVSGVTADNICLAGEDLRAGDIPLRAGQLLRSRHIATLAMAGCDRPSVFARPSVGLVATGSELVEPGSAIAGARIRDCNSAQLVTQVQSVGAVPCAHGIVRDDEDAIEAAIRAAFESHDVVIITGGVSVGELDLVPEILTRCGCKIIVKGVAIKPGRPTLFGVTDDGTYCFGLPGNPLSAFVVFELLVKPFIYRLMGHEFQPLVIAARLGTTIRRKKTARLGVLPVTFVSVDTVVPVECHGAAHASALCTADGLLLVPVGTSVLEQGTTVNVRLLRT
jgi:molybdopterin molybdotransferase